MHPIIFVILQQRFGGVISNDYRLMIYEENHL